MTFHLAAAFAILLLVGAGCLGSPPPPTDGPVDVVADRGLLRVAGEATLLSNPQHPVSEFQVFADPTDPMRFAVSAIDGGASNHASACVVFVTRDAGKTWIGGEIDALQDYTPQGDPWVVIDDEGTLHLICMTSPRDNSLPSNMFYVRSFDDGATWSTAVALPLVDATHSVDKNSFFADAEGVLHATYWEVGAGLLHVRSDDRGDTWSEPVVVVDAKELPNGFERGPDGTLFILVSSFEEVSPFMHIYVYASRDNGSTWSRSAVIPMNMWQFRGPVSTGTGVPGYTEWSSPSLAVSPRTGDVWVALQTKNEGTSLFEAWTFRSQDHAATFEGTVLTFQEDVRCADCHSMRPAIAFDETGTLALQVHLEDGHRLKPEETWLSTSDDDGSTWQEPILLGSASAADRQAGAVLFVPGPEDVSLEYPESAADDISWRTSWDRNHEDGGHYWEIAATHDGFLGLWIDHRDGGIPKLWARSVVWDAPDP